MSKLNEELGEIKECIGIEKTEEKITTYTKEQLEIIRKKKVIRSKVNFISNMAHQISSELGYDNSDPTFPKEDALKYVPIIRDGLKDLETAIKNF